jgi:hypothetical protein
VDLFFGRVEGKVADVEGSCVFEFVFGRRRSAAVVITCVAVASALLEESQSLISMRRLVFFHTLAVAYELGLSRRSMVLRSAGMMRALNCNVG